MATQKPPNPKGKLTGFPYDEFREELGPAKKPLYDYGFDRALIDWKFAKARELGAPDFGLTKFTVLRTLVALNLRPLATRCLARKLYYLAGHYYAPRFHKLFGDDLATSRRKLTSLATTARKMEGLMSRLTLSERKQLNVARWSLESKRRRSPYPDWSALQDYITDLASSAHIVAEELPQFGRGSTEDVLLGRWLRQSAEAIEQATEKRIIAKSNDSAGKNFRFEGAEGGVFESYCQLVDRDLARKTMVNAVQAYHRPGVAGSPPK